MRFLFVKSTLGWPRTYGHDVHCYEMMRALRGLGHDVALATETTPSAAATTGLNLSAQWTLDPDDDAPAVAMSYLQERYRSYWGVSHGRLGTVGRICDDWRPDVYVVVGLEVLPYLVIPPGPLRIWYAADEWVLHYASQLLSDPKGVVEHVKAGAIKGLYERAFGPLMDRVWVVSSAERRAMRLVSGCRNVDVIPNGVDTDTFRPDGSIPQSTSAVFWGRLGFGPNLQALRWFSGRVWPLIRQRESQAALTILGADPPEEVQQLHGRDGMTVVANLPDLKPAVNRHAVAVLPFVSGGGIKNKLLEAAAMARPVVATSRALSGLRPDAPILVADDPEAFASAVLGLWRDPAKAAQLGESAREWVRTHHTWQATAEAAIRAIQSQDAHSSKTAAY
jgi:glycosyltransferase involved in cell wall biosynthesis